MIELLFKSEADKDKQAREIQQVLLNILMGIIVQSWGGKNQTSQKDCKPMNWLAVEMIGLGLTSVFFRLLQEFLHFETHLFVIGRCWKNVGYIRF